MKGSVSYCDRHEVRGYKESLSVDYDLTIQQSKDVSPAINVGVVSLLRITK